MFLLRKVAFILTYIVTLIIRRDNRRLVLGAWFGKDFNDNTKYLLRHLCAHSNNYFDVTWVTKSKSVADKIKCEFGPNVRVVLSGTPSAYYHQLRGSFFTVTGRGDVDYHLLGGASHFELWHGIPLKKINYDTYSFTFRIISKFSDFLHKYKYFVVGAGKKLEQTYCSAFDVRPDQILNLGQCRTDVFFDDALEYDAIPEILKGRYILYMPTHRREGEVPFDFNELLDLRFIDELCNSLGIKFIIKKHFYHTEINSELKSYSNIIDITELKVDPLILLKYSEALITDYSSCYIDYLLLGRPIIYYCYDLSNYVENERGLYRNFIDAISAEPIFDKDNLNIEIEKLFSHVMSEKYIDTCLYYHDHLPGVYNYQSSARRLTAEILKRIH